MNVLGEWDVEEGMDFREVVKTAGGPPAIFDYANDFHGVARIMGGAEAPADGILAAPEAIGHGLVDDGYKLRVPSVGVAEISATKQRDAHRLEIIRCDSVVARERNSLVWRGFIAINLQSGSVIVITHGHRGGEAGGLNARDGVGPVEKSLEEAAGMSFVITCFVRINGQINRKSTRLNSSHGYISYAVFC